MLAAMQLDLFTPLRDGPLHPEALAAVLGVDAARLRALLYALVVAGLLAEENGCFANTPEANHYLVRGSPAYMGQRHELYSDLWSAALRTAASIRLGAPQARHDFATMTEDELASFLRGLHPAALATARLLAARFDFSNCRTLLDVGGGSGGVSIALAEAYPHLQATVVDLPVVTPITQRFVTEANAGDRVGILAADFVQDALTGTYDIAVMRAFIQVLPPAAAQRALSKVHQLLNPGGNLYLIGQVLDNSRLSPIEIVGVNLVFLNIYEGGQAYTEQEYREWLAEAGYVDVERIALPAGASLLRAKRPV
jgi:SAM-dependent methyltransferase